MITVFGATGNTGSPLVDALLDKGAKVRAVTSAPAKIESLRAKGCEAVIADFNDPAALKRACEDAEKIYLVTPAHLAMRQWKANTIEAAMAAGVRHVVLATGLGASPKAGLTFGKWHSETQELLKESGLDWTFVQPTYFMQNLLWQADNIAKDAVYYDDLGGPVAWVDALDRSSDKTAIPIISVMATLFRMAPSNHPKCPRNPVWYSRTSCGKELSRASSLQARTNFSKA